jgi:putative ABC transport system permease protein
MFDLEKEIIRWKQTLYADADVSESDIAELESHFRDEIDHQIETGLDPEAAFRKALENSASGDLLGREYEKFRPLDRRRPFWHPASFMPAVAWNYLKIAGRILRRHFFYTAIKVFGLAVGLACALLVLLFVQDELSFDRFHKNADRIFRVTNRIKMPAMEMHRVYVRGDLAAQLPREYSEVQDAVRFMIHRGYIVESGGRRLETDPLYVDPNFLEFFTFPLRVGDPASVLRDPQNAVLTEDFARKLFGNQDPLGRTVTIYDQRNKYDLKLAGIAKNVPRNSHIQFEFLASLDHLQRRDSTYQSDRSLLCPTYIRLADQAEVSALEAKLPAFVGRNFKSVPGTDSRLFLQPLTSIHLHSNLALELGKNSTPFISYGLGLVALIILLLASFNFINLSTAQAGRRAKEVGLRKTIGAARRQLVAQFLGETFVLTGIALMISLVLCRLLLPLFNSLMDRQLRLDMGGNPVLWLGLVLIAGAVGFASGLYPAFVLSAFRASESLRGERTGRKTGGYFVRKGLVVLQFAVSLVLILGAFIIVRQFRYIQGKNLGFQNDRVFSLSILKDPGISEKRDLFERELRSVPGVQDVVFSSGSPGIYKGFPLKFSVSGRSETESVELALQFVGYGFFDFFGIGLVQGRDFNRTIPSDEDSAVVLNESAAQSLGPDLAVGKIIKSEFFTDEKGAPIPMTVIGVVRDYHNGSLHDELKPAVYQIKSWMHDIFIRLNPANISGTLKALETKWRTLPTHVPFNYFSYADLAESFVYAKDRRTGRLFGFSSVIAVLLSCLGIVGLMSFSVERRKKEIGIRKVLGAGSGGILALLIKDFSKLVLAANIVAWPVGFFVMRGWLQSFAYRTTIPWWMFVASGAALLLVAMAVVSLQSFRATRLDPIGIIRHE